MYEHIVLNEPHASMEGLYDAEKSFWNIDADFLNNVGSPDKPRGLGI